MKTNMRIAFAALLSVSGLTYVVGQEGAPAGRVPDGMRDQKQVAPTEIPSTAPKVGDIGRLFDEPTAEESAAQAAEQQRANGMTEMAARVASPLDEGMSLDASDLISVDYPNEEIRTVLRNVADLYSLNIVVPDTLQGTTSIKLRDVTWRQIYSVVLDPVGYTFVEDGPIIKIVSKEALNFEPPVTEIFMINYAEAEVISNTIKNLVDPAAGGKVQVDKRTNALIVSERSSKMEDIRMVIQRLDKPTQQIFIETRFIEVTDTDVKNIGINWSTLRDYGVGVGNINKQWGDSYIRDRETGTIKEGNDERNLGNVSFKNGAAEMSGVGVSRGQYIDNLTGQKLLDATSIGETSVISSAVQNLYSLVDSKGISRTSSAIFTADQFGFVLSALKEQGGSKLVSNPTVVTLNNQEANIAIGEQFPIPAYQYNEETGGFEVSGFNYKDIGIILKVTPSVNHTGLITLKVEPEISTRTRTVNFGGSGQAEIPVIATRRSSTQIALRDGFTMGIGGLMESTSNDNQSHVPVLGKVPGIGKLFRHQSKEESKRNLLIFITARILPSEEADFEDVFSQEMMEDVGVSPVSLKNR